MTKGDKSKYKVNDMTVSNGCVANAQKKQLFKGRIETYDLFISKKILEVSINTDYFFLSFLLNQAIHNTKIGTFLIAIIMT